MTRGGLLVVGAALLPFLAAGSASARCFIPVPICQSFWQYEAVFDGTATRIERFDPPKDAADPRPFPYSLVTYTVHKAWRGVTGREIQVLSAGGFGVRVTHSFVPDQGTRYVIFAQKGPSGHLVAVACGMSLERERAAPGDIAFLQSLDKPGDGGRVFGAVTLRRNPHGPLMQDTFTPLPARVNLTGEGLRRTVESQDGRYEFTRLPPGSYTVSLAVPPKLSAGASTVKVQIPDMRACAEGNFTFDPTGSVGGVILGADGRRLKGVRVDLADAAQWNR